MNSLTLFLAKTEQTFTLEPTKIYTAGSTENCDISLPIISDSVPIRCLQFEFDPVQGMWFVEALGSSLSFAKGRPLTRCSIEEELEVKAPGNTYIVLTPEENRRKAQESSSQSASYGHSSLTEPSTMIQHSTSIQPSSGARSSYSGSASTFKGYESRPINLGFKWFQISSPDDGVGVELRSYGLIQTYQADRKKVERVCERLYEHVLEKVNEGCVGDAKIASFVYKKGLGDRRKFIRVSRDTEHGVRTTVFIRFLGYGDNLYIGLNVYVLGDFNWIKFLIKSAITGGLILISWAVIPLIVIIMMWWKLGWRVLYEKKVGLAFRQEFPGGMGADLFNIDDIAMFAKSTVRLTSTAIYEVFEKEGLPLESLNKYIQQINNITNVNTEGGDILNSAVGAASQAIGNQGSIEK